MHQRVGKEENKLHAFAVPQKEFRRLGNEYNNLMSPNPENKNHFLLKPNTILLPCKHRGEGPFHQVARGVQGPEDLHSAQVHVGLCTRDYLVAGVMEDVPPRIASPLHGQQPVLEDPMIELQTVEVVQLVDVVHFDAFVVTLSKG